MKKQRISNKSFERNLIRFEKRFYDEIEKIQTDSHIREIYGSECLHKANEIVGKLYKEYKTHPFKNKSAYTFKISVFPNKKLFHREVRIGYYFENNCLVFKFLTRRSNSKYKRVFSHTIRL